MKNFVLLSLFMALLQLSAYAQQPPPRKQLRMVVRPAPAAAASSKPPAPVRQAGDDVQIDPASGDLIVKSGGTELRVQRRDHVNPAFSAQYSKIPDGVQYSYHLTNGKAATQYIHSFTMDVRKTPVLSTSAPPYWWYVGECAPGVTDLNDPAMTAIMWGRMATDDDPNGRLIPGATAGPFLLKSAALPGLVRVYADGWKETPIDTPGEEAKLEALSPWIVEQTNQLLRFPTNAASVYTIGPKVSSTRTA